MMQLVWIGDDQYYPDSPSGAGSKIMVLAMAKGIEYSPAQAAAISVGLS